MRIEQFDHTLARFPIVARRDSDRDTTNYADNYDLGNLQHEFWTAMDKTSPGIVEFPLPVRLTPGRTRKIHGHNYSTSFIADTRPAPDTSTLAPEHGVQVVG